MVSPTPWSMPQKSQKMTRRSIKTVITEAFCIIRQHCDVTVPWSVCLSVTFMHCAETAEVIDLTPLQGHGRGWKGERKGRAQSKREEME